MRKFRLLQKPMKLLDLLNSVHSRAEEKIMRALFLSVGDAHCLCVLFATFSLRYSLCFMFNPPLGMRGLFISFHYSFCGICCLCFVFEIYVIYVLFLILPACCISNACSVFF